MQSSSARRAFPPREEVSHRLRGQWKYLTAIAKEKIVRQPTSSAFLEKYRLGAAASSKRTLDSLVEKELVLETLTEYGSEYCVYNVFLSRWLERI